MTDFTPEPAPRELIRAIHVRGVKEPHDVNGISATFLHALDQDRFLTILAAADMDYGAPVPFAESYAYARARVIEQILIAPGPVVLSGYSGGAYVIGDLARDIAEGRVDGVMASDIAAVALLADPLRPEGEGAPGIPTPGGYGIAGQRYIPDIPAFWGSASRDAITACAADNPLRTVADLSTLWSVDPLRAIPWAQDVMHRLIYRQLQPWWMHPFRPAEQWGGAIDALNGYLWQGHHTNDYLREGVCVALAAAVNEAIR